MYFQWERRRILDGTDHLELRVTPEDVRNLVIAHANRGKRAHRKSHGKISFRDLARTIAARWKKIDEAPKAVFDNQAMIEKEKYSRAYKAWKARQKARDKARGNEEPKKKPKKTLKKKADGVELGAAPIAAVTMANQSPPAMQQPGLLQPIPALHQHQQQMMNQTMGQQQQAMMNSMGVSNVGMNMNGRIMMNNESAAKLEALKAMLGQINTEISSQMNAISMTSPTPALQNHFPSQTQQSQMQNQMSWNTTHTSNIAGGQSIQKQVGQISIQDGGQVSNLHHNTPQMIANMPQSMGNFNQQGMLNMGNMMMNQQGMPYMGNNNTMGSSPILTSQVPANNMSFELPSHLEPNDVALL